MTGKKSFLIILRVFFILFSLQFVGDAFYRWDGYSYYMRFMDFLPDLSLAFILWTIIGVILASALWGIAYGLFRITSKFPITIRLEHVIAFFIFTGLSLFIKDGLQFFHPSKRIFFIYNISPGNFISLIPLLILIIGGVLVVVDICLRRKYLEKMLYGLDTRITPLVWLFALLFILAVPFSLFKNGTPDKKSLPPGSASLALHAEKRPNIILVTMDALTALDMEAYGYGVPTTPFISKWAKDATVFNRAYSSSNWTGPAAMSLITGQRPWTHKVWFLVRNNPVENYETGLPMTLKDYGYAVYGFVQNEYAHPDTLGAKNAFLIKDKHYTFWIPSGWWFDKFANFFVDRPIVQEWLFETNPIAERINDYRPDIRTTLQPSEIVYNRFLEFIKNNSSGSRPFFAWLHVDAPHGHYLPPEPYMGVLGDAQKFNTYNKQEKSGLLYTEYPPQRQADVDILRKRYDEFIMYSDKQFELFLLRLAKSIDVSNTIIILSSDHGESFSHGYRGHSSQHLYEPLVHIPLIIKMPGRAKGEVIDSLVEQIDIAPTILKLAGIPVPQWMEGRSLTPLFEDKHLEPRPIFSMQLIKNRSLGRHPIAKGTIAVWDGDYKLIYYLEPKKALLFNLLTDPDEIQNIYEEQPEIAERLLRLINDQLSEANERIIHSSPKQSFP